MLRTDALELFQASNREHWTRFCELFPAVANHPMPTLRIDGRYRRVIAHADIEANCTMLAWHFARLNDNFDLICREVIPHELAHHIDYLTGGWIGFDENYDGHGEPWQKIMVQYGLKPSPRYPVTYP